MSAILVLSAVVTLWLPSPQDPDRTGALAKFSALDESQQNAVLLRCKRELTLHPNGLLQRIVWLAKDFESYPQAEPIPFHDPGRWAPGVAPKRVIIRADDPECRDVRDSLPKPSILPVFHKAVHYDWRTGKVVRRAEPLGAIDQFENLLDGYPPGADAAVAHILAELDRDPKVRKLAWFFEHLYANRDGGVYEGITIYEAFYSGETIEMPDVDAVCFAVEIMGTDRYRSPIPGGPGRDTLYAWMGDSALAYRRYRSLREVAAGTFLRARPEIDLDYRSLAKRFHFVFADLNNDVKAAGDWLETLGDRDAFLRRVDSAMRSDSAAADLSADREAALSELEREVRAIALRALSRQT